MSHFLVVSMRPDPENKGKALLKTRSGKEYQVAIKKRYGSSEIELAWQSIFNPNLFKDEKIEPLKEDMLNPNFEIPFKNTEGILNIEHKTIFLILRHPQDVEYLENFVLFLKKQSRL